MNRFEKYRKSEKGKLSLKNRTKRYLATEKGKLKRKEWVDKNRKKVNKYQRDRKLNSPESVLYTNAKNRAKRKGVEFNIDINDIIVPEFCPILGLKLIHGVGRWIDECPSLDRIDSTKGYIKDNIHVISYRANMLKNNATIEELEKIVNFLKSLKQ